MPFTCEAIWHNFPVSVEMTQNNKQKIGSFPGPFANQRGPFLLWTETRDWSFILKWNRIQGLSKKESKLHSTHRCRSRHVFGGAKDFVPKFARKVFGKLLCVSISFHTNQFWDDLQKKSSSHVGCQFIKIKQRWAPFLAVSSGSLPRISCILPGFSTNQNFWRCACTPASYTSDSTNRFFVFTKSETSFS